MFDSKSLNKQKWKIHEKGYKDNKSNYKKMTVKYPVQISMESGINLIHEDM